MNTVMSIFKPVMSIFKPRAMEIDYVPGMFVKEYDGWRGVAILMVVLIHFSPDFFPVGWVGMELFFVLSGFFITGVLVDSKSKKRYYLRFIERRVLRIFPLYYLCLIILLFLLPHSWYDMSYYRSHQAWFWLYMDNWLYSIDGWPKEKALHHFWSLAIEEQFYVLWPLAVWLCSAKGLIRTCVFLCFFSVIFRNVGMQFGFVQPFTYVATFGRMEGLALGSMVAVMLRSDRYKALLEKYAYPVTVFAAGLAMMMFFVAGSMRFWMPYHYSITYTVLDVFFAGMITLTLCRNQFPRMKKMLNNPALRQIGVMSYCIYIFHYPILCLIQYNFLGYFEQLTHHEMLGKFCCLVAAFLVIVPVVYFFHKKVEMPILKLKKRV